MNVLKLIEEIEKVDPEVFERLDTRKGLLSKASNFAGKLSMASLPFVFGAMFKTAYGKSDSITDVLNFALTLEYLESEFYSKGLSSGVIPQTDRTVFMQISKHESSHVSFLKTAINTAGGTPIAKPTFDFTGGKGSGIGPYVDYTTNYATFLTLSQAFEDTGVRAYKGQAGNLISSNEVLSAALQIHSVEARHAAIVRRMRGQKGWITGNVSGGAPQAVYNGEENLNQGGVVVTSTEAYDEPLAKEDVQAIVDPFIV